MRVGDLRTIGTMLGRRVSPSVVGQETSARTLNLNIREQPRTACPCIIACSFDVFASTLAVAVRRVNNRWRGIVVAPLSCRAGPSSLRSSLTLHTPRAAKGNTSAAHARPAVALPQGGRGPGFVAPAASGPRLRPCRRSAQDGIPQLRRRSHAASGRLNARSTTTKGAASASRAVRRLPLAQGCPGMEQAPPSFSRARAHRIGGVSLIDQRTVSSRATNHIPSSRKHRYIDPGNYGTDLQAGATYQYKLLFIVLLAGMIGILVQTLSARLGIVTGKGAPSNAIADVLYEDSLRCADLSQLCRASLHSRDKYRHLCRWGILYPLYFIAEGERQGPLPTRVRRH